MNVTVTSGTTIGGWIPISQLANAAILHGLVSAMPAAVAHPDDMLVGDVSRRKGTSTAAAPIDPAQMRTAYGVSLLSELAAPGKRSPSSTHTTTRPSSRTPTRSARNSACRSSTATGGPTLTVAQSDRRHHASRRTATAGTGEWDVESRSTSNGPTAIAPNANIILFEANAASVSPTCSRPSQRPPATRASPSSR